MSGYIPRCEDCAFTPGTAANSDDITRLKRKLCVEAGEPFYCHEEVFEHVKNGLPYSEAQKRAEEEDKDHLCGGWVSAMIKRQGKPEQEEWRRNVLLACLDVIYEAERDPELTDEKVQLLIRAKMDEMVFQRTAESGGSVAHQSAPLSNVAPIAS